MNKSLYGGCAALLFVIVMLAANCREAAALDAYVDFQSGIIIGRGAASLDRGVSYSVVREMALKKARDNIRDVLERQPADVTSFDSRTVRQYVELDPDREAVFAEFVESAQVFREFRNDKNKMLEVTLILPVEGANGYKAMIDRLMGRVVSGGGALPGGKPFGASEVVPPAAANAGKPYVIALFEFQNVSTEKGTGLGELFTQRLKKTLSGEKRFDFMGDVAAAKLLARNGTDFDALWIADPAKPVIIDGADGLVMARITRWEPSVRKRGIGATGYLEIAFEVEVDFRILNTRTGKWVHSKPVNARIEEKTFTFKSMDDAENMIDADNPGNEKGLAGRAFGDLMDRLAAEMRKAFPMEGYVVRTSGNYIYLNLCLSDGVKFGDTFVVYRMGDMLYDPVSGKPLDRIRDRITAIRITDVLESYSQASVIEEKLQEIRTGDIVIIQ